MNKAIVYASAVLLLLLSGCGNGHKFEPSNIVTRSLPVSVQHSLSNAKTRAHHVSKLPLSQRSLNGGVNLSEEQNILFIDPTESYAIKQYESIWNQIKNKPAVVWVNATNETAQEAWSKEGYSKSPLPSLKMSFTQTFIPTPDSYHKGSNGWIEEPGILQNDQVNYWVSFFR